MSLRSIFFSQEAEWFWVMLQSIIVSITLICLVVQLRIQGNSHVVNSFAVMDARWKAPMMLNARNLLCQTWKHDSATIDPPMHAVCLFFEEMGVYVSNRILNANVVWELYSFEIEHYWVMCKNSIHSFRKGQNDDSFYHHFERLYNRTRKISKRKGAPTHERGSSDIKVFINHEGMVVSLLDSLPTSVPPNAAISSDSSRAGSSAAAIAPKAL